MFGATVPMSTSVFELDVPKLVERLHVVAGGKLARQLPLQVGDSPTSTLATITGPLIPLPIVVTL